MKLNESEEYEIFLMIEKSSSGYINAHDIKKNHNLESDLEMNWLDEIDLSIYLEAFFNITISDDESSEWETVNDILQYIESKLVNQ